MAQIASERAAQVVKGESTQATNMHLQEKRASTAVVVVHRTSTMKTSPVVRKQSRLSTLLKRPSIVMQLQHRQSQSGLLEFSEVVSPSALSPSSAASWELRQAIPSTAACIAFFGKHDPSVIGLTDEMEERVSEETGNPAEDSDSDSETLTSSLQHYFGDSRKSSLATRELLSLATFKNEDSKWVSKNDTRLNALQEGEVRRLELVEKRSLLEAAYGVDAVTSFLSESVAALGKQCP